MSIITVASGKGGCGKTTISEIILGLLAREGYAVAGIDTDINQTLAKWGTEISDVRIDARAETNETRIVPLAAELEERCDLVVIDTAGAAAQATVFAIGCADLVLIPTQLSSADLIEGMRMRELVVSASQMTKREIPHRLILTDYQPKTNVAQHVERLIEENQLPVMATKLNRLVAFKEMTFTGEVPATEKAGFLAAAFVRELAALGALPFYQQAAAAVA